MMDTLRHDLALAIRSLRRRPTFTALAVATLAAQRQPGGEPMRQRFRSASK